MDLLITMVEFVQENFGEKVEILNLIVTSLSTLVAIISIIITNVITIRINNKNLKRTKEQFEISLQEQEKQFDENFELQKDLFIKNQEIDNEKNRISIMPYFELIFKSEIKKGNLLISFRLRNVGNGTAINVRFEKEELCVYKDEVSGVEYIQCDAMSKNIVKVDEVTECSVMCTNDEKERKVILCVAFEDMMQRGYIQKFSFSHSSEKIVVTEYYKPECVHDYNYFK